MARPGHTPKQTIAAGFIEQCSGNGIADYDQGKIDDLLVFA